MRRWITPLAVILALQLVLAVSLSARRNPLAGASGDALLIVPETVISADQVVIEGDSGRVELLRKGGSWILPAQFDAPADAAKVGALLDRLGAIKRGLPIATTEAALRRFKLVDDNYERRLVLSQGGKALSTIYFGSSPGLRKSDARTQADHAVYAVDMPIYELPTQASGWLDGDLLHHEAEQLAELDVLTGAHDSIQLLRQKGTAQPSAAWTDPTLKPDKQIDSAHAETLARTVAQMHVDDVLGTEAKPEWQQDRPVMTLKLQDDKAHSVDWTLSKPTSGDYYVLKSSAHPWYFSISGAFAKQMVDAGGRDALIVASKPAAKPSG
jgi:hypothetical protein